MAGGQSQDVLSPPHLLSHPLNKVLLCSERRHCVFLSVLKILQCRKLRDVEPLGQGLVDSGIDSCKDSRALGWGRGQPCMTASDAGLAEEEPNASPQPTQDLPAFHGVGWLPGLVDPQDMSTGMFVISHLWAEMRLLNLPHQSVCVDYGCSQ